MLLYIWKKQNGSLVFRYKKDIYSLERIGDKNSYGWVLVGIQILYKGSFYDYEYYRILIKDNNIKKKRVDDMKKYIGTNWVDMILFVLAIFLFFKVYFN